MKKEIQWTPPPSWPRWPYSEEAYSHRLEEIKYLKATCLISAKCEKDAPLLELSRRVSAHGYTHILSGSGYNALPENLGEIICEYDNNPNLQSKINLNIGGDSVIENNNLRKEVHQLKKELKNFKKTTEFKEKQKEIKDQERENEIRNLERDMTTEKAESQELREQLSTVLQKFAIMQTGFETIITQSTQHTTNHIT